MQWISYENWLSYPSYLQQKRQIKYDQHKVLYQSTEQDAHTEKKKIKCRVFPEAAGAFCGTDLP